MDRRKDWNPPTVTSVPALQLKADCEAYIDRINHLETAIRSALWKFKNPDMGGVNYGRGKDILEAALREI